MATEVKHDGITHRAKVSPWDGLAISLCGEAFEGGSYKESIIYGGVDCRACKRAKRLGKSL